MRKTITIIAVALVCAAAGYGLGTAAVKIMKKTDRGGSCIGPSEIRIEDGKMTPEVLLSLGRLSDPQLSPDGTTILYGVSYTSIKENRSCRNLFVCNADGSSPKQLTRLPSSVGNARWSNDGKSIFFTYKGQIWKAPYSEGKLGRKTKLSEVPSGVGEFAIAPDGCSLIYTSTVKSGLQQPTDVDPGLDKAQAYITEDLMYRHWDHWVTETPRSFVAALTGNLITDENSFDILGGEEGYELPTEPFGGIEQLAWAPDSRHIAYSCRKLKGKQYAFSTNSCIYIYDVTTGECRAVTTKGGYDTDPVWSNDGTKLAWISMERDGYEADRQRIMVADLSYASGDGEGQCFGIEVNGIKEITEGFDRDASGILWSADDSEIVFAALSEGVQSIFRADLANGGISRLTPADLKYDFFAPFHYEKTDDGSVKIYTTYYCLNFPAELVEVDCNAAGEVSFSQITRENEHILSQVGFAESESVSIRTVDGKDMQAWVLYPPEFDSTKVYPAIEIVLGGPQGTNSQDWSYRWCYRLMADNGYIVILPNRRGTTAFGQEWKEQISGDYSGLNMQDYLSAGRWIKEKPYVGKLACVGASYGGYSAYMLEGLHDGLYDCFVAHAGIFDEKMLWFTTEEMWFANWDNGGLTEYAFSGGKTGPEGDGITFGGMQQAGAPYSTTPKALKHYASSPSGMVTKWNTPILCIHGMMDFRIPYGQGMAAFNAPQMMAVPYKLLIFPEENHSILQPPHSLLWHREVFGWLDRWLKDAPQD
ncbi:MAG: S9 family peptidase [Bacteroidales bacterium]|nr:S9 family peptidase [Bacteroidales bacterium]